MTRFVFSLSLQINATRSWRWVDMSRLCSVCRPNIQYLFLSIRVQATEERSTDSPSPVHQSFTESLDLSERPPAAAASRPRVFSTGGRPPSATVIVGPPLQSRRKYPQHLFTSALAPPRGGHVSSLGQMPIGGIAVSRGTDTALPHTVNWA